MSSYVSLRSRAAIEAPSYPQIIELGMENPVFTYLFSESIHELSFKKVHIFVAVVATFRKVNPSPFATSFMDAAQNRRTSEPQTRSCGVSHQVFIAWSEFAVLDNSVAWAVAYTLNLPDAGGYKDDTYPQGI